MPFITQERRDNIGAGFISDYQPGDKCFVVYRRLMRVWKGHPSWTTADYLCGNLYGFIPVEFEGSEDWKRAADLAWQVFFNIHVMKYEEEKRGLNGDI